MTITTDDELKNGILNNSSRIVLDKASLANAAAAQVFSLWTASGTPGAGSAPGTTPLVPTNTTVGAFGFQNQTAPMTSYLAWLAVGFGNANSGIEFHDRLAHVSGLSGTVTTAQGALSLVTTNPGAERIGDVNYSDVQWWLEVYTALGATGVNATVNVTYDDNSTGNLAAIALGATPRQGRLYPLVPAVAGRFIKAVNSVTLSATTGTAGNFGITATRPRTMVGGLVANMPYNFNWADLGGPEIPNNACLFLIMPCSTTSTGTVRGQGKIAHG